MDRIPRSTTRAKRLGLSLVETIVVAGLISSVFLLCMGLIPSFKLSNRRASMELEASAIAQRTLENSRAADFDTLETDFLIANTVPLKTDEIQYQQTVLVTPSASGLSKTVRVTLNWNWRNKDYTVFREGIRCQVPRS